MSYHPAAGQGKCTGSVSLGLCGYGVRCIFYGVKRV